MDCNFLKVGALGIGGLVILILVGTFINGLAYRSCKLMVKIFTNTSFTACVFAGIATLLLAQIVTAWVPVKKNSAPTNPPKKVYPSNQVKTYPANNDLPLVRLITMQEAIKNSGYMRITEAKLTTYGEYAAKTGEYKTMFANNRMIWMIIGYVPGKFSYAKGRITCSANARIITLIDAETGDGFGRGIYCPPGNETSTFPPLSGNTPQR